MCMCGESECKESCLLESRQVRSYEARHCLQSHCSSGLGPDGGNKEQSGEQKQHCAMAAAGKREAGMQGSSWQMCEVVAW